MKQYTFNDADRLKQVIETFKKQSAAVQKRLTAEQKPGMPPSQEESKSEENKEEEFVELTNQQLVTLVEECQDLVELHPRNNLNLCLMGGLTEILCMIFSHENETVRKAACRVLTTVCSNNPDVQDFANKAGTINLASQLEREKTPQMREAILGCLYAFLKGSNFSAKRLYI